MGAQSAISFSTQGTILYSVTVILRSVCSRLLGSKPKFCGSGRTTGTSTVPAIPLRVSGVLVLKLLHSNYVLLVCPIRTLELLDSNDEDLSQ